MRAFLVSILFLAPSIAFADPAVGVWQTEPDRKDLVSHIEVAPCGAALCGRVLAAFDAAGARVTTRNVGKRLFWDLMPQGGGNYDGGRVFVPLLNIEASATARLSGNTLRVTGCKGAICDGQTWTRVR